MKFILLSTATLLLAACDGSPDAKASASTSATSGEIEMAPVSATGAADGNWSCRTGAALVGGLRVAGTSYVFDAADGASSGRGRLSGEAEILTIVSGPLKTELGLLTLVYHMGSQYPSLTGMNDLGAAMTCFQAD